LTSNLAILELYGAKQPKN